MKIVQISSDNVSHQVEECVSYRDYKAGEMLHLEQLKMKRS